MAIAGGSNPISKHVDDILKDENRKMPAAELPREEKDAPAAGGGDELNVDELDDEAEGERTGSGDDRE
ncbi:hypothetical protein CDO44_01120 [Pigmentiphaga sp. NML080357]|jgi:hypothetical protein|uniref:hypothetical protein n=1 Tax=Pigmentiphaga sp. NML080357 TaxID=2008675 RepID=UPI000B417A03|nr:hypothetical protein [Pigmentiphaga sp. NML080357]OVZ64836.1 hypothetical protein CDO44_01120 [Pigmentiphaga sp. NML080357]